MNFSLDDKASACYRSLRFQCTNNIRKLHIANMLFSLALISRLAIE